MPSARRPRLLVNPAAARGRGWRRLARGLPLGELDVRETASPAEMTAAARQAVADGLDRVLVAGGDGSLHHAAQALAGTDCALGIVPCGSGNDLARALGLPADPARAATHALAGARRRIDVGRCGTRVFLGVLGLGIDGDVCRIVERDLRRLPGALAYAAGMLLALWRFEPPTVVLDYDDGSYEGRVMLAALANSPCFGGGMRIAPDAVLDDGWLELVVVEQIAVPTLLRVFPRIYRGRHTSHPAVRVRRARAVRVRSLPPRTLWADGEPLDDADDAGREVSLWPGALQVIGSSGRP